jgi:hypothetical protein
MLADPRRYAAPTASGSIALGEGADQHDLVDALRDLAHKGRDDEIARALAAASSQRRYAELWRALRTAIEKPGDDLAPRVFAIPWVIVCGGNAATTVDAVLPDLEGLAGVLQANGAFGASRTVGLSNALCSIDALESLPPSAVLRGWEDVRVRDVSPEPMRVARGVEAVHVRFLLGAAVVPPHTPDIVETGANVGAWGSAALRAMAAQLATPDVQILPMPRPPCGLYTAAYAGRRAGIEAAFNLFMSNSVRRFRRAVGDPRVTVSTHASGEVRVTLWNPLDDAINDGFRWPLHAADDLDEIERTITTLVADCRLAEPDLARPVLDDFTSTGAVLFPAGGYERPS